MSFFNIIFIIFKNLTRACWPEFGWVPSSSSTNYQKTSWGFGLRKGKEEYAWQEEEGGKVRGVWEVGLITVHGLGAPGAPKSLGSHGSPRSPYLLHDLQADVDRLKVKEQLTKGKFIFANDILLLIHFQLSLSSLCIWFVGSFVGFPSLIPT